MYNDEKKQSKQNGVGTRACAERNPLSDGDTILQDGRYHGDNHLRKFR